MSSALPLPASGLPPSFKSRIAERVAASHDPLSRWRAGRALELYYEAGDPHSQLCAELARRLLPRLTIPLTIRVVGAPQAATYPEAQRQRAFAAIDAARLAPCHALPAPLAVPEAAHDALAAQLCRARDAAAFLQIERQALDALAAGRRLSADPQAMAAAPAVLAANGERQQRLGHYLPAMWQYRGEWFWALDRLSMLQARLAADGALHGEAALAERDATQLPVDAVAAGTPLEFWFSFRSPYSYLAAVALLRRRAAGACPALHVRPVLPMVMRGLPVPAIKRLYIVRDVQRCADAQGIAFGRIHDPLGDGALRLLTIHPYDADADTQLRFCAVAAQSVWAEGLDARREAVLHSIVTRAGLDWPSAQRKLAAGIDTSRAEANRAALFEAGLWGVPSFRLGRFTTWGQDRLWMVDRLLSAATANSPP